MHIYVYIYTYIAESIDIAFDIRGSGASFILYLALSETPKPVINLPRNKMHLSISDLTRFKWEIREIKCIYQFQPTLH